MAKVIFHPFAPLLLFSIALTAILTTYLVAGFAPSETFEVAAAFGWSLVLALWLVADARRRSGIPCFDFGLFCYLFLPVAVPWYCFWSRGWRGALLLVALLSLWLAPYVIAGMVGQSLYG